MKTHVCFRSGLFPPNDLDGQKPNPELFGNRLAEFLAAELRKRGFETREPLAEDWGWVLPVKNERFHLWIGCGRYGDDADRFLCFIEPHRAVIRRFFRKIDTAGPVLALQLALDEILSANPAIQDVKWSTYDEFNHAGCRSKG